MYTEYFDYTSGATVYAKTRPLNLATWGSGIITLTENGSSGEYSSATFSDDTKYAVYEQLGGSPASSDLEIGRIDPVMIDTLNTIKTKTNTIDWADIDAIKAKTDTFDEAQLDTIQSKTDTISWADITAILNDTGVIDWSVITTIKTSTDAIDWSDINTILTSTGLIGSSKAFVSDTRENNKVIIYQGATFRKEFQYLVGGVAEDISGATVRCNFREGLGVVIFEATAVVTDGPNGLLEVTIPSSETAAYKPSRDSILRYDIEADLSGGDTVKVQRGNALFKTESTR